VIAVEVPRKPERTEDDHIAVEVPRKPERPDGDQVRKPLPPVEVRVDPTLIPRPESARDDAKPDGKPAKTAANKHRGD